MMSQAAFVSIAFLAVLSLFAFGLKVWKRKGGGLGRADALEGRVLNVISLGAHERVITVEVGSPGARCQLVLGVTPQAIRTLHVLSAQGPAATVAPGADSLPRSFGAELQRAGVA